MRPTSRHTDGYTATSAAAQGITATPEPVTIGTRRPRTLAAALEAALPRRHSAPTASRAVDGRRVSGCCPAAPPHGDDGSVASRGVRRPWRPCAR